MMVIIKSPSGSTIEKTSLPYTLILCLIVIIIQVNNQLDNIFFKRNVLFQRPNRIQTHPKDYLDKYYWTSSCLEDFYLFIIIFIIIVPLFWAVSSTWAHLSHFLPIFTRNHGNDILCYSTFFILSMKHFHFSVST